jgi:hypothetical protein
MNEISSLVNLRALILNGKLSTVLCLCIHKLLFDYLLVIVSLVVDNEISSICKLDLLKDLNSLGMFFYIKINMLLFRCYT